MGKGGYRKEPVFPSLCLHIEQSGREDTGQKKRRETGGPILLVELCLAEKWRGLEFQFGAGDRWPLSLFLSLSLSLSLLLLDGLDWRGGLFPYLQPPSHNSQLELYVALTRQIWIKCCPFFWRDRGNCGCWIFFAFYLELCEMLVQAFPRLSERKKEHSCYSKFFLHIPCEEGKYNQIPRKADFTLA